MKRTIAIAETILTLGLNRLIARLGVDPRWRWALWAVIATNEIRGAAFVWQGGKSVIRMVV